MSFSLRILLVLFTPIFFVSAVYSQDQIPASEVQEEGPVGPQTREELDRELMLTRMGELYGQKRYTKRTVWEVSRDGETQEWVWNGAGFDGCESTGDFTCANWVPTSFQWFLTRNNWLEGWDSFSKEGFYLGETKAKPRMISAHSVLGAFLTEELAREDPSQISNLEDIDEEEIEDEEILVDGKRLASEIWVWSRPGLSPFKVYSSLRNQWIERIDHEGAKEIIEWKKGPKRWSRITLERVVLEKDGQRLTFKKSKKKAPKK